LGSAAATASESHAAAKTSEIATKAAFALADGQKNDIYDVASNWCDLMATTLGKKTPEGKAILAIRANLKGNGPNKPSTPPTP